MGVIGSLDGGRIWGAPLEGKTLGIGRLENQVLEVLQEEKEMELGTGLGLGLEEEREMRERGEGEGNAEREKCAKVCFYFQEIFFSRGKRLGLGNPYR